MKNLLKDTRLFVFKAGILSLTVIALVLLCIFSCNNLLVLSSGGALIVSVPGGRAISDATIYTIELKGTNGSVYSKTVDAGQTAAFEELVPDTYTILVKGSNGDIVVYYGSTTAIVEAGKTASAMVELMSLLGGLNVEFSGTAATSKGKSFLVDLRGSSGSLYTKTVAAGETAQFERLVPDIYTIDVHGTNANNAVLYHGINTATVEVGKKTSATVDLVVEATDFESLKEGIELGGPVYVVNDITVTGSFTISTEVEIQALDKDVTLTYTGDGSLFTVNDNAAKLRIGGGEYMLTLDGNGKTRSTALVQITKGTVDLYGTITNNTNNDSAAGIKVNGSSSTLNMYDGAIVSNCRCGHQDGIGGAIGLESGTMNMYGGSITGNSAQDASAVYVNNKSVFTMSGGTISGNSNDIAINVSSSTFKIGGGALISSDDKVSLKNIPVAITIISPLTGGNSVATLTLKDGFSSGTTVLTAGDGVTLANEVGKFVLTSGTIKSDGTLQ